MPKPFLSFEQQINKLENEKNLLIPNHDYAKDMLMRIGYFTLISGYKEPFRNRTIRKYKDGTTFDDIVNLYEFDENLRELFLKYILKIERNLRSLISYYFTEKYGENQAHYLDVTHFTSAPTYRRDVSRLINTLSDLACTNTNYPYINYQRKNYRNVPLWVLFNSTTLGTLSKFYSFMTSDLKVKVSKNFDGVNESQLEQYLRVITKFRNVCAHGDRLFTYNTHDSIPDTPLHQKLGIAKRGAQYIYGKTDLFAIVIAFRYFLPSEDFLKFKASLNRIIKHYLRSSTAITEVELLPMMGFPQNWAKIMRYKK